MIFLIKHFKMKSIFYFILIGLISSCAKKLDYSKVPQINFKSFNILSRDSAALTLTFSDGDGDIGGSSGGQGNMFITYYYWNNDSSKYYLYKDTTFLHDSIDVRTFPSPSNAYKNKPISGEITAILIYYRPNNTIKKLKLAVYIQDNSGNKSNIIKTPDIYAP